MSPALFYRLLLAVLKLDRTENQPQRIEAIALMISRPGRWRFLRRFLTGRVIMTWVQLRNVRHIAGNMYRKHPCAAFTEAPR